MNLVTPSLLITDDDADFRATLRDVFEPRGFRTLLAESGEEALGIVRQETVHLLLLDMHMPKLTGLDTIRQVHTHYPTLPWILMTARLDEQLRNQAEQEQASSVLPKPFSFLDLTTAVGKALHEAYGWDNE